MSRKSIVQKSKSHLNTNQNVVAAAVSTVKNAILFIEHFVNYSHSAWCRKATHTIAIHNVLVIQS